MTSGRYVAVKVCLEVTRGRLLEEEVGEGVSEEGEAMREGCGKEM